MRETIAGTLTHRVEIIDGLQGFIWNDPGLPSLTQEESKTPSLGQPATPRESGLGDNTSMQHKLTKGIEIRSNDVCHGCTPAEREKTGSRREFHHAFQLCSSFGQCSTTLSSA